mgnify:FL=1
MIFDAERSQRRGKAAAIAIAVAVCAAAAIIAAALAGTAPTQQPEPSPSSGEPAPVVSAATAQEPARSEAAGADAADKEAAETPSGSQAESACEHDWKVVTKTEHVDEKTETVEVPAVWETSTRPETVCNACMAIVTGKEAEHTAATGHAAFTRNVPVEASRIVSEARTETRVVQEAGDVEVPSGFDVCTRCGAQRQSTDEELAAYGKGE